MKTIYERLDDMEAAMDKLQAEIDKCSDTAEKERLENELEKLCVKYNQLWNVEDGTY
jgi:hypothetical protein